MSEVLTAPALDETPDGDDPIPYALTAAAEGEDMRVLAGHKRPAEETEQTS